MHDGFEWEKLRHQILAEKPDVLVTSEMPFGGWPNDCNVPKVASELLILSVNYRENSYLNFISRAPSRYQSALSEPFNFF